MYGTATMGYSGSYVAPRSYAAPMTTAAPMMTTAAPMMTTAAPMMTTAAPMTTAMPQMTTAVPQPMAPVALTQGMPTPEQIAAQKANFASALDSQLKDAIATIQKETQIEKDMVKFTADKQISLYNMQVDERLTEALALAEEQATVGRLELNKAKVERGLQLNSQAQGLVFDYNMRSVQQELAQRQYQFQQQYMTAENKLAQDYAKTLGTAGPAAMGVGAYGGIPATTAVAAPQMTYAAPQMTYAAPATTAIAAPQMTYAAPATTAIAAPRTTAMAPAGYGAGYGAGYMV